MSFCTSAGKMGPGNRWSRSLAGWQAENNVRARESMDKVAAHDYYHEWQSTMEEWMGRKRKGVGVNLPQHWQSGIRERRLGVAKWERLGEF